MKYVADSKKLNNKETTSWSKSRFKQVPALPKSLKHFADRELLFAEFLPRTAKCSSELNSKYDEVVNSSLNGMNRSLTPCKIESKYNSGRSFQSFAYRYTKLGEKLHGDGYSMVHLCALLKSQLGMKAPIPVSVIKHFFIFNDDCLYSHILYATRKQTQGMKTNGYSQPFVHESKPQLLFVVDNELVERFEEHLHHCQEVVSANNIDTNLEIYFS